MSSRDALRVALALAVWKAGPAPADPAALAQQQLQQQAEVGAWLQRAIAAAAAPTMEPAAEAIAQGSASAFATQGPAAAGAEEVVQSRGKREAEAGAEGGQQADALEAMAAAQIAARRQAVAEVEADAARAFVQRLPVSQARVLAGAVAQGGQGRQAVLSAHVVLALQERAGYV